MNRNRLHPWLLVTLAVLVSACAAPAEPEASPSTAARAVAPTPLVSSPHATAESATSAPEETGTAAPQSEHSARNMSLVGALPIEPQNEQAHADVAVFKQLAFIGSGT